jgi:hypothetical protein
MKLDVADDDVGLVIRALEHYYAYTVATKCEDSRYRDLAERLKRKPVEGAAAEVHHERAEKRRA